MRFSRVYVSFPLFYRFTLHFWLIYLSSARLYGGGELSVNYDFLRVSSFPSFLFFIFFTGILCNFGCYILEVFTYMEVANCP